MWVISSERDIYFYKSINMSTIADGFIFKSWLLDYALAFKTMFDFLKKWVASYHFCDIAAVMFYFVLFCCYLGVSYQLLVVSILCLFSVLALTCLCSSNSCKFQT